MSKDIRSIYATALRDTHALEKQGLEQMQRQISGLADYPDYAAMLLVHINNTKTQLERLDAALDAIGEEPATLKETATRVAGSIGALGHALAGDEALKNLFAGYAFQHEQIAVYRSLVVVAEAAGHSAQVPGFRTSIEEETQAAHRMAALIEPVTKTYLARTSSGPKTVAGEVGRATMKG